MPNYIPLADLSYIQLTSLFKFGKKITKNRGLTPFTFLRNISTSKSSHSFTLKWLKSKQNYLPLFNLSYFDLISLFQNWSKNHQKPWVNPFTFLPNFSTSQIDNNITLKWLKSTQNYLPLSNLSYFDLISLFKNWSKNHQKPWVNPFTFFPKFFNLTNWRQYNPKMTQINTKLPSFI